MSDVDDKDSVKIQLTLPRHLRAGLKMKAAISGKTVKQLLLEMVTREVRVYPQEVVDLVRGDPDPEQQAWFMRNAAEPTPASLEVDRLLAEGDLGPARDELLLGQERSKFKPGDPRFLSPEEEASYETSIQDYYRWLNGEIELNPLAHLRLPIRNQTVSTHVRQLNEETDG